MFTVSPTLKAETVLDHVRSLTTLSEGKNGLEPELGLLEAAQFPAQPGPSCLYKGNLHVDSVHGSSNLRQGSVPCLTEKDGLTHRHARFRWQKNINGSHLQRPQHNCILIQTSQAGLCVEAAPATACLRSRLLPHLMIGLNEKITHFDLKHSMRNFRLIKLVFP